MVNSDIAVMLKKKTSGAHSGTYLKLLNIRSSLKFPVSESYEIAADVKIGRSRECEIKIDDPFMSAVHAEILLQDGYCFLHDMGSTNGTLLNGEAVEGDPIELING
ncbi:MAG: FHA domain-containing protein, partial [Ruminococcaceae bacterium]|nr:FHA domain-containing protein [Oscillospiraceae bacterium]